MLQCFSVFKFRTAFRYLLHTSNLSEEERQIVLIFVVNSMKTYCQSSQLSHKIYQAELLEVIGIYGDKELAQVVIFAFISLLEEGNMILKSMCYQKFRKICQAHGMSAKDFLSPYWNQICDYLWKQSKVDAVVCDNLRFLGSLSIREFFEDFGPIAISSSIVSKDLNCLQFLSDYFKVDLADMLIDYLHHIIVALLMLCDKDHFQKGVNFLLKLIVDASPLSSLTFNDLIKSCSPALISKLLASWGQVKDKSKLIKSLNLVAEIQNTELSVLIHSYSTGILYGINEKLSSNNRETQRIGLDALVSLVELNSAKSSNLFLQVINSLQIASAKIHDKLNLLLTWSRLIEKCHDDILKENIYRCYFAIDSLVDESDEFKAKKISLIDTLIIRKRHLFDAKIIAIIVDSDLEISLLRFLQAISSLLNDSTTYVLEWALIKLKGRLSKSQNELQGLIFCESIDPLVTSTIQKLLNILKLPRKSFEHVQILSFQCLGFIGAIDPDRLNFDEGRSNFAPIKLLFSSELIADFSFEFLETKIIPLLKSCFDHRTRDRIGHCIQELLKFSKVSPSNGSKWNSLDLPSKNLLLPYFNSKYAMSISSPSSCEYPIDKSQLDYADWIIKWLTDLSLKVKSCTKGLKYNENEEFFAFLMIIRGVLRIDCDLADFVLSHVILFLIQFGNQQVLDALIIEISDTLQFVLQDSCDFNKSKKFAHLIFHIYERHQHWSNLNDSKHDVFIDSIPEELLASASLKAQEYTRALFHYERILRNKKSDSSKIYSSIQKIYSAMQDQDGMTGIGMMISACNVENQILESECCGNWTGAQTCYELLLSKNSNDIKSVVGLAHCLSKLRLFGTIYLMI